MFFRAFARAATGLTTGGLTLPVLACAASNGYRTIHDLGGATTGDRIMLDALHPAVEALERALDRGATLAESLGDAAESAQRDAEATATMTARRGRASSIGDAARLASRTRAR